MRVVTRQKLIKIHDNYLSVSLIGYLIVPSANELFFNLCLHNYLFNDFISISTVQILSIHS